MMLPIRSLVLTVMSALATACWVDPDPEPAPRPTSGTAYPSPSPSASGSTSVATPAPLVVQVDTGRTLNAAPGEGIGVFVEYSAGGQWHVWWTCDTLQTRASCNFEIDIVSENGSIKNVEKEDFLATDHANTVNGVQLTASSQTGSNKVGLSFDTPPGGTVSIDARVAGVHDGSIFFFVQDGKPNGGYAGQLTNPLKFKGSAP